MILSYDLATCRPDMFLALILTESDIPITYNENTIGSAKLTDAGRLNMTVDDAMHCRFATGGVKFNFVRSAVPEDEVDHGRNQMLVEVALQDNF